jgi:hypothetical protein
MAGRGHDDRNLDPGVKLVLEELRDLRLEMRADRERADGERRQADEERRRAHEERRRADEERRRADEKWQKDRLRADEELRQERLRSDERFQQSLREFREDSARREAATQKAFKGIHTVGLSIVKTLNHHTRILERIERKLGGRWNGRRGPENGRRS